MLTRNRGWAVIFVLLAAFCGTGRDLAWSADGSLKLVVQDAETGQALTARMYLKNSRGRSIRAPKSIGYADNFIIAGDIILKLPPDTYEFELEKGPEYQRRRGYFEIVRNRHEEQTLTLGRIASLAREGWWSGDLLVSHPPDSLRVMMQADDVHCACVTDVDPTTLTAAPEQGPWIVARTAYWPHELGDLVWVDTSATPFDNSARGGGPSTVPLLRSLRSPAAESCLLAMRPYASDMPIWLASGKLQAVCLLHGNLRRTSVMDTEEHGRTRERVLFPPPYGNARWSMKVYTELLNAGQQIPPVAASESGRSPNTVGYNRVYVHCESPPTLSTWWQNLRAGRVFVTNGPLLRVTFNNQQAGHVFHAVAGDKVTIECQAELATREKVQYLEIIRDGEVVHDVRLESLVEHRGQLPPITFEHSGWLMVRAVTAAKDTYRAACTGPVYVRIGDAIVSPRYDMEFWTEWVTQVARELRRKATGDWPDLMDDYRQARDFFAKLGVARSTP